MVINNPELFKKRLDLIRDELMWATCSFRIWEQLWPSTEENARIENLYLNFFTVTRKAHNSQLMLCISNILDRNSDSVNIYKLLKMMKEQPSLMATQTVDIVGLKARLDNQAGLFKKIKTFRNKRLAHIDEEFNINKDDRNSVHIYVGDIKKILDELSAVITELSIGFNGVIPTFETVGIDDTSSLLTNLISAREYRKLH